MSSVSIPIMHREKCLPIRLLVVKIQRLNKIRNSERRTHQFIISQQFSFIYFHF